MQRSTGLAVTAAALVGAAAGIGRADTIFSPTDFVIAIDGTAESRSSYPATENPPKAIDAIGNVAANKYLNFGVGGTGFIVQPGAATTVRSFQITTAGDAAQRDPSSWVLLGTNSPIVSADNSNGLGGEIWTVISQGALTGANELPAARNTPGPIISFANSTPFTAYKMYFPTLKAMTNPPGGSVNSMQFAEVQFFDQPGGAGNPVLAPANDIRAIDNPGSDSMYPTTERPLEAIDGLTTSSSKYLNFAREGTGLIITPGQGPSIVTSFQVWTANDVAARDPSAYQIFGTNDPIISADNSDGTAENWTMITSGTMTLPDLRNVAGDLISFSNGTAWRSYKIVFTDNKGPDSGANSIQFAELIFNGTIVPEPSSAGVLALACGAVGVGRRRRCGPGT
jgi:hypothetical protein